MYCFIKVDILVCVGIICTNLFLLLISFFLPEIGNRDVTFINSYQENIYYDFLKRFPNKKMEFKSIFMEELCRKNNICEISYDLEDDEVVYILNNKWKKKCYFNNTVYELHSCFFSKYKNYKNWSIEIIIIISCIFVFLLYENFTFQISITTFFCGLVFLLTSVRTYVYIFQKNKRYQFFELRSLSIFRNFSFKKYNCFFKKNKLVSIVKNEYQHELYKRTEEFNVKEEDLIVVSQNGFTYVFIRC